MYGSSYQRIARILLPATATNLRRRRLALLAVGVAAVAEDSSESGRGGRVDSVFNFTTSRGSTMTGAVHQLSNGQFKVEPTEGLMLYYDPFSFYSQKVVMTLYEKNLEFETAVVNLAKSQQYEPWYLFLNPRGEVPVLQDTRKIIPDSARIIDYLEDNVSLGDTPRLIPMDQGAEVRQNVTRFRHLLQQVPEGSLTTGAMLNQHLLQKPKMPFIGPVRKALASAEKNAGTNLRKYAETNEEARPILLEKAAQREKRYHELSIEQNFLKVINEVDHILTKIEEELASHKKDNRSDWWLCSKKFSIADVELTCVLIRINQLGLEHLFWTNGKRPHIEEYFNRVQKRQSYKNTVPGTFTLIRNLLNGQTPMVIGVVAAVALVIGGVFVAKKYI